MYYDNYSAILDKKNFSQRALRRKDIKEYKVYQKTDYSVFRKKRYSKTLCIPKKTLRLCVLCVRYYINYSVACSLPEKVSWIKEFLAKYAKTQRY